MDEQKTKLEQVKLEEIDISKTTQLRLQMNSTAGEEYTEVVSEGDELPPIRVFHERLLGKYFIGDGWHTFEAYAAAARKTVPALVSSGGERAAWIHALGANAQHGIRRTPADRENVIRAALADDEMGSWSDSLIADACGVGRSTVQRFRNGDQTEERVGADGKTYPPAAVVVEEVEVEVDVEIEEKPTQTPEQELKDLSAPLRKIVADLDSLRKVCKELQADPRYRRHFASCYTRVDAAAKSLRSTCNQLTPKKWCDECGGTGNVSGLRDCTKCLGSGWWTKRMERMGRSVNATA